MSGSEGASGTRLGLIGAFLLGLLLIAPVVASAQVSAQPGDGPRTIRVSGTGEIRVEPDLATVQFAVETTGTTAQEAGQQNAEAMDRVIRALVDAGIGRQDIQTSGYALYPEYAAQPRPVDGREPEPPRIRGYRASNQVSVRTTDLDRVGRLIDIGLEAGANRMNGVSFELQDAEAARSQALARAVESARRAAETIAMSLGVNLGEVLDASTSSEPVQPLYRARDMAVSFEAAPTPIEPGQQTVRATASLTFAIR